MILFRKARLLVAETIWDLLFMQVSSKVESALFEGKVGFVLSEMDWLGVVSSFEIWRASGWVLWLRFLSFQIGICVGRS